jgi:predicted short-subunit dehydrogenase-like oxidoreductase (DUF2520 family)
MTTIAQLTLGIIGCGHVGKVLGRLLSSSGAVAVQDVLNRSAGSAQRAVAFIGEGQAIDRFAQLRPAEIYMIAASDDQIVACGEQLAAAGLVGAHTVVFHCSGALRSDALAAVLEQGGAVASIHPIRSFADPEQMAADFGGTWCGVEGNPRALDMLGPMLVAIGARLVPIDADFKNIYHSAAVFASNYLVTLLEVAANAYVKAGMPKEVAIELMGPLVRTTVDNVLRLGPAAALTGPIARGDMETALRQLHAVADWNPEYGALYKLLGRLTADLAGRPHELFQADR